MGLFTAKGVNVQVDTGSGFNQINGLTVLDLGTDQWGVEDTTSHTTSAQVTTSAQTLLTFGALSFTILWDFDDDVHTALRTLFASGGNASFKYTHPFNTLGVYEFTGFCQAFQYGSPVNGLQKGMLKITPVGTVTDDGAKVISVTTNPNGTANQTTGDTFIVFVHWNEYVKVDTTGGIPHITMNDGGPTVAAYVSGSKSNILKFSCTWSIEDNVNDGSLALTALLLNSGTIKDMEGNNAVLTLNNVNSLAGISIN